MTNAYADLTTLKSAGVLNITGTGYDTRLRELLETVSRLIDRYCNRHYYVLVTTRKFDGDGGTDLVVQDMISVTSLKTDDNKDRTFETTWAATDYLLYPANAEPTKVWGGPYTRVLVDLEAGNEDVFTQGSRPSRLMVSGGTERSPRIAAPTSMKGHSTRPQTPSLPSQTAASSRQGRLS